MGATVLSALEIVADIIYSNPQIELVRLVTYEERPTWRDKAIGVERIELAELLEGLTQDVGRRALIERARSEISVDSLQKYAANLENNRLLGVCSDVVIIGGRSMHIPMMDFICAPSESNLTMLAEMVSKLGLGRGYILESGRSY